MLRNFETPGALSSCDYDFDSVSTRSSTVVDSVYAAEQVLRHEMSHQFRVPIEQTATTNAINIQIQLQNNAALATSEVNSVERITANKTAKEKLSFAAISRHRNCKMMFLLIILLVIVVTAVTLFLTFHKNMNANEGAFEENSSSTSGTTRTEQVQSSTSTTTPLMTTTKDLIAIVSRSEWGSNTKMKGTKRLKSPVKLLIIMDTQTDTCDKMEDCSSFLKERQKSEYINDPKIKDIRENFLIASDGTVYEGRGFLHEGQHTYDGLSTDYNPNAIGIAFIGNYTRTPLTASQEAMIHKFIQSNIENGKISENYLLYHQDQLALKQNLKENVLYAKIQTWHHWTASPAIISKKQWGGLVKKGLSAFLSLIVQKSVALGHSNDSSCSDLSSCSEIIRKMQLMDRDKYSDVRYNFVLGGEDLIFQGRSFDWRGEATSFALDILFVGNFMDEEPPQSLLKAFEDLIRFAVSVGKLSEDFKLYGQRQLIRNTESPGDKLYEVLQNPPFDAHFDFNVTTPKPCEIGCTLMF